LLCAAAVTTGLAQEFQVFPAQIPLLEYLNFLFLFCDWTAI
jgi:hypothetical protein